MQFKDFTDLIIKNIKNYLPDEFADAEVSLTQVNKNNGITLDGLIIQCVVKPLALAMGI